MLRRLSRRPAVQAALARLLGLYLLLVFRTTRWRVEGWERVPPRFLSAFWHEMLPLMPLLVERAQRRGLVGRAHVLVSRHRDGRFIAAGVRRFGVETVHASSSKGGAAGALALLRLVRAGRAGWPRPAWRSFRRWPRCRCCRWPGMRAGPSRSAPGTGCACRCPSAAERW